jgi:hypothetical protein
VAATVVPEDQPQSQALPHSLQAVAEAVATAVVEMVVVEAVAMAQYYQLIPVSNNMKPLQVSMDLVAAVAEQPITALYMVTACQAAAA